MNKAILVGRLTRDPDIRYSQSDNQKAVARFCVAMNRNYKNEKGESDADFISCIAFGKTAEFVEKYFSKGMKIGVVGRIQSGTYTNKDGNPIYFTDIVAESVEFVEKKAKTDDDCPFVKED